MMRFGRTIVNLSSKLTTRLLAPSSTKSMSVQKLGMNDLKKDEEANRIVWMDLEMTGLDPDKDHILELTCAITDSDLRLIADYEVVIHQSDEILENMSEWCQVNHKKSGLVDRVRESKISLAEAETQTINFIKEYTMPNCSPLAGNSVHMDKFFMMKQMPQITNHLHYRIIDVSTIKELAKRWNPPVYKHVTNRKKNVHRAKDDILESIEELKTYRENFLETFVQND